MCSNHFLDSSFVDPVVKKRLNANAVPIPFGNEPPKSHTEIKTPGLIETSLKNTVSKPRTGSLPRPYSKTMQLPQIRTQLENKIYSYHLQVLKKKMKYRNAQIASLKAKIKHIKPMSNIDNLLERFNFPSEHSKALASMQFFNKHRKWSSEERKFAFKLFYKCSRTYDYLQEQNIILPGISTLRKWIGESSFESGLCPGYLQQVKAKFQEKSHNDRLAVLCFDELSLKECLDESDEMVAVEAFERLHNGQSLNSSTKCALVFILRGLFASWNLPLAYYLTHISIKGGDLATIVVEIIEKLLEANVVVKVCVCDQGSNNSSAYTTLGVTVCEPFFSVNDNKIFAIYDVPYLYKNIRRHFQDGDFIVDGKIMSFKDVVAVYNIDKNNTNNRSLSKLTDGHINIKCEKKNSIRFALQIFSKTVASCLRSYQATGELASATAQDTADFIEILDQLFDSLNSKTVVSKNSFNSALSSENACAMTISKAEEIFSKMFKFNPITNKRTRPICFDGVLQTIAGIKVLLTEVDTKEIQFLLLSRLNQDVLRHLFAICRQRIRYDQKPSLRTLKAVFKTSAINALLFTTNVNFDPNMGTLSEEQYTTSWSFSDESSIDKNIES